MLTLSGSGVSQHSWLSAIPSLPRLFWPEEVRWCLQLWRNHHSLQVSHASLKNHSEAEGLSCRNLKRHGEIWCPQCFRGDRGPSKSCAGKWNFLERCLKCVFSVPDPNKEKTPGSFVVSSVPWLLLQSCIFSESREKGAKQCCLGRLIIYHTAQTLNYQYAFLFQSGHLVLYMFLIAGPNSVVLLWNTDEFCRDATSSASYPTKSESPKGAFRCKPVGWCYRNISRFICSFLMIFFTDPKDNLGYKYLVPWIGMYYQGFASQGWFWS